MQIFIDTAKIDEIRTAISWGIVDGITTNPSLIRKAAESTHIRKIDKYIDEILKAAGKRPVSLEVKGGSSEEMLKQARKLYRRFKKKGNNVVIKIPIDPAMEYHHPGHFEGLKAISALSKARIPVNVTLVFSPEQALLAAKAGATYVSPFAGRIDDLLRQEQKRFKKTDYYPCEGILKRGKRVNDNGIVSGVDLVWRIVQIFRQYKIKSKVIAASLRNSRQVREVAGCGADILTIPFSVLQEMVKHDKTIEGMKRFTQDLVPEYEALMR